MEHPADVKAWRKSRRAELLARRQSVPPRERDAWRQHITELLVRGFPVLRALVVSFYWPFKGEFDPRFLMREIRRHGARTVLPVVIQKAAPLEFREWWPGVRTSRGVFDLPVPEGTAVLTPQALIVPPIGFDEQGYRLGYGGGYFDRTLAAMSVKPLKIGVAFELSRMPTIHPQPHDIAMDFIVTEGGVYRAGGRALERVAQFPVVVLPVGLQCSHDA